jgi:hypothetical protein
MPRMSRQWIITALAMLGLVRPAVAGPPFVSDGPEPTDYKHFEIYVFSNGTATSAARQVLTSITVLHRISS